MTTEIASPLKDRLAIAALFLGATGIAFSPIFVRLTELDPITSAFYRPFLALPLMFLMMAGERRRKDAPMAPKGWRDFGLLLLAGVFFAGDLGFWHWSIALTSVANSTLLANFAPIFVTLGAFLLFKERVSRGFVGALVLSLAGALMLMGDSLVFRPDHIAGDALGMITALFYASYILTVGKLRHRFSAMTVMAWSGLGTVAVLLPVAAIFGDGFWPQTWQGWLPLIGLGVISHALGQGLIAYALAHLSSSFSSVGLLFQPLVAAALAWLIFAEAVAPLQFLGACVILVGIFLARRASRSTPPARS
ncbi:MAG: DMT family transporter [Magnetospiraceae bacterium]